MELTRWGGRGTVVVVPRGRRDPDDSTGRATHVSLVGIGENCDLLQGVGIRKFAWLNTLPTSARSSIWSLSLIWPRFTI